MHDKGFDLDMSGNTSVSTIAIDSGALRITYHYQSYRLGIQAIMILKASSLVQGMLKCGMYKRD